MNRQILKIIENIINVKTDIVLTVSEYDSLTVVNFTGQQLRYVIYQKCLTAILNLMDDLKKLGYEICIGVSNVNDILDTITTIIIKKPTDWNETIHLNPMFMYTQDDIEPEQVDNEYTGNILLNQESEKDIIIDFHDNNTIPVKIRINTMSDEPSYGIVIITDEVGYREIKLFNPHGTNFDNIQRLKDYNHITWLMTLIAKYIQ